MRAVGHSLSGEAQPAVTHVEVPQPVMGAKAWLLNDKGLFVLERGPGTIITCACTHGGSGGIRIIDGIPDENGFFTNPEDVPVDEPAFDSPPEVLEKWGKRNGRAFYTALPAVMGSWMLNAGFHNGLTIHAGGGHNSVAAVATFVWQPFRRANVAA
jgi:hypothetical protein